MTILKKMPGAFIIFFKTDQCGQYNKASMSVNYASRVVLTSKCLSLTTLDS